MPRRALTVGLAVLCLAAGPAVASDLGSFLPQGPELAPLVRAGTVERHDPDSLWEKINGEAELYRKFGLVQAVFAYYEDPSDPSRGIEASLFRMRHPLGAFGLFAAHRQPGAAPAALGNDGQADGYQVWSWYGDLFVVLHGFGTEDQRRRDLAAFTRSLARNLGLAPDRPEALAAFESLTRPGSVRYHPEHLLSRETLPAGLSGEHPSGLVVICSTEALPGGWTGTALALTEPVPVNRDGVQGVSGRDAHLGPLTVWWSGTRLLGIRSRPDAPGAGGAVRELFQQLLP